MNSNLPPNKENNLVRAFDAYYSKPLEIEVNILNAMTGFFQSREFDKDTAQALSVVIIKQAKKDGLNPMKILDTIKGLATAEISALVAEILNFNRVKTSFLGYARQFNPSEEITRNILA